MKSWKPTVEQQQSWEEHGYYVERCALSTEIAAELRGIIKNQVLLPEPDGRPETDPMDPMGNSPAERSARFRKLSNFCITAPHIWHTVHCGEPILRMAKHHLGHDVIVKFNSVFVKPARTGSATPWHQDNGLWRDGETAPYNFWMALDPATKMNGCLQFAPGTHKGDIVQHVLYEDSIHGELPRNLVVDQIEQTGVHHVELEPGDVVAWHSSLWHYSPPNPSEQSRIGVAGVYTNPKIISARRRRLPNCCWVLKEGKVCTDFPPEPYPLDQSAQKGPVAPFPKAEQVV
ncbi:MAG: hypothetical protein CME21_01505 [Gemmatimonadetes bacterium]|jgi:ectoine hydroxylase-related dioxygenase (phytanoyl-CoA dioxygenase family)|nr:hypothetical protein [Gemmatimonadota bacterium]HCK10033.1 hypothetical protein [Candidatus Latescibacterota bacterium]